MTCDRCQDARIKRKSMQTEWGEDQRGLTAQDLFQRAYAYQQSGQLEEAVLLYRQSIATLPTAEGYTFLGWAYRLQGKTEEAIQSCEYAILIDPTLGNPYNDIGAYLIDLGHYTRAIQWLEKATECKTYSSKHYPWFNLGRAYAGLGDVVRAWSCYARACEAMPNYRPALEALQLLESRQKGPAIDHVRW